MEIMEMIIFTLLITIAVSKKHHFRRSEESEESIENLLYYKDCKHKPKTTTEASIVPVKLQERVQPECPCPKMCCSMCCDCGTNLPQSFMSRQMPMQNPMLEPMSPNHQMRSPMIQPIPHQPALPFQPGIMQMGKKKRFKPKIGPDGSPMVPPIGGRREFGFTRQNIKSLIAQDSDIKKILKDLVRVTMTKVDQKKPLVKSATRPPAITRRIIEIPNMSEEDEE